jgi:Xaa-Pro aminopeptidase
MANQITAVKKACKINDEAIRETLKNFQKFKTEKDIANFLNRQIRKSGADLSFPTIVANGKNAFELHHKPKNKRLARGFTVIDFGAKVSGFTTDVTRTIFIGTPRKKEKKLYNLVLGAQKACVSASKPGSLGSSIDHLGTKLLGQYAPYLKHAVGHGLGKKVHDKPSISPRSADILKAGQVVAIEPGIYLKGKLGIRIEDTVLIRKKPIALSKFTKNLITIKLAK